MKKNTVLFLTILIILSWQSIVLSRDNTVSDLNRISTPVSQLLSRKNFKKTQNKNSRISNFFENREDYYSYNIKDTKATDLRPYWDEKVVLINPHKGFYHHYLDNRLTHYLPQSDSEIEQIPGMDHIYLRLAWSYLEPQEGQFNWKLIDDLIDKWVKKGYGISLRISCKELQTEFSPELVKKTPYTARQLAKFQSFATPEWVKNAGANGKLLSKIRNPIPIWEPDYDDPIFLEKLENFITEFAKRYDGKPWLRYVDIGSYGSWGEGHNWPVTNIEDNTEVRIKHINVYLRHFTKTQLVITDDFVYKSKDGYDKLLQYIVENGITFRDDSILVKYYVDKNRTTYSVSHPQFYQRVYQNRPVVLELQHYSAIKRDKNWLGKNGEQRGANILRGALQTTKTTYLGYHGDAQEWFSENPSLTKELANRVGYWYFPIYISYNPQVSRNNRETIRLLWVNRGVAPAYHPYNLVLRLENSSNSAEQTYHTENTTWLSGEKVLQQEQFTIHQSLPPGTYNVKIKLIYKPDNRDVLLGLSNSLKDKNNFYTVGKIIINS
ncbi:MAG: DUF4832 domain-containing protein [Calothrix sp. MO_167.B12]|nr:DUF4832 domain-containing protein [Calothrix sp. MO_167.B12]